MHKALAMYHHHQACAARLLRNQIQRLSGPPDSALFSAIISFLTSSIQKSAYGTWRAHLNGASTLLDMWGMQSLLKSDQFIFYIFMTTDIFGMTTSPSTFLTPTAVDHHHSYLIFISQLRIKTWSSLTPIPDDLLIAIISMNIRRADSMHVHGRMGCDCKSTGMTVTSILAYTQAFSPENWAAGICSTPGSPQLAGWSLLARCFQGAVCLYILLCDTSFSTEECCGGRRNKFLASTYMSVATCIHKLFDRRYCAGNFHKFLLWPMVITGVEAVAQHDRTEIEFLCQELRAATISLGTMAMREAAVFLEHLWSITWTDCQTSDRIIFDWNVVFERAPIFMM
jgi:hypothetical protein